VGRGRRVQLLEKGNGWGLGMTRRSHPSALKNKRENRGVRGAGLARPVLGCCSVLGPVCGPVGLCLLLSLFFCSKTFFLFLFVSCLITFTF
jgi:hypothetical protein